MRDTRPEIERWSEKVNKSTYPCWTWKGTTYRGGYGHFRRKINGRWVMYKAHRYSYEHFYGPIPEGMVVRHKCDNPSCVNPDHLEIGTSQDNTDDRKSRKGIPLIRNPKHNNLDFAFAQLVRRHHSDWPQLNGKQLAEHFGTSPAQISRILSNKIWAKEN